MTKKAEVFDKEGFQAGTKEEIEEAPKIIANIRGIAKLKFIE